MKESLRTRWSASIAPTTSPDRRDGTTLTTPSGSPASASNPASASAVSGVSDAGFTTAVHPAASAGPSLRVSIAAGKFHGVTISETPIGWPIDRIRLSPAGAVDRWPWLRTASSENQRRNSAA